MHTADPLTWAAGLTYLAVVAGMSVFGAALYASYVRSGLHLVHALSEREARLQSYFDLAPVGTAVLRADGTISEGNDELCRLLGHTRDEIVRLGWVQLAPFQDPTAPAGPTKVDLSG